MVICRPTLGELGAPVLCRLLQNITTQLPLHTRVVGEYGTGDRITEGEEVFRILVGERRGGEGRDKVGVGVGQVPPEWMDIFTGKGWMCFWLGHDGRKKRRKGRQVRRT